MSWRVHSCGHDLFSFSTDVYYLILFATEIWSKVLTIFEKKDMAGAVRLFDEHSASALIFVVAHNNRSMRPKLPVQTAFDAWMRKTCDTTRQALLVLHPDCPVATALEILRMTSIGVRASIIAEFGTLGALKDALFRDRAETLTKAFQNEFPNPPPGT